MLNKLITFVLLGMSSGALAQVLADQVDVNLPSSRISGSTLEMPAKSGSIEFLVSNWQPTNFSASTRLPNTNNFQLQMPRVELNFVSTDLFGNSSWSLVTGGKLSYAERTGVFSTDSQYLTSTQKAYFFTASVGVQRRFPIGSKITPYASLSALPTVTQIAESPISRGSTQLMWPYQVAIGSTFNIGLEKLLLTIEAYTENFANNGAAAGLRWNL